MSADQRAVPLGESSINSEAGRRESERRAEAERQRGIELGKAERWISVLGGGALLVTGLLRRGLGGTVLGLVGAGLAYRGVTGRSHLFQFLGLDTTNRGRGRQGFLVEKTVTFQRSPAELYRFWRNLENLPRFMTNLESVTRIDERRSRWVARAPADQRLSWDAEIVDDREGELIVWRSVEGADIENEGAVRFAPAPGGQGTELKITLRFHPPGGELGALATRLFGADPAAQLSQDLERLQRVLEAS